jgi:TPR repeat protein
LKKSINNGILSVDKNCINNLLSSYATIHNKIDTIIVELGENYLEKGYISIGIELYNIAINYGNLNATRDLAYQYHIGIIIQQNYIEATKLYKVASKKGCSISTNNLANIYYNGFGGIKCDSIKGKQLYKKAISLGCVDAKLGLAHVLGTLKGPLVSLCEAMQSIARIRSYFTKSNGALRVPMYMYIKLI